MKKFLALLLITLGTILLFHEEIIGGVVSVSSNSSEPITKDVALSKTKIERKNETLEQTSIETKIVIDETDTGNVIGAIYIPDIELNLKILQGAGEKNLMKGATTVKENQKMGIGNYVLSSHHMKNPTLLFSPLDNITLGTAIYITDLKNVYEYTVYYKDIVAPNSLDILYDKPNQKTLTLFTCSEEGESRLVVTAELRQIREFDYFPTEYKDEISKKLI